MVENLEDLVSKKDLRLSILEPDGTNQGGMLTLAQGGTAGARYNAFLQPCGNPICSCSHIHFQCQHVPSEGSGTSPDRLHKFWLDAQEHKVAITPELKEETESLRLAEGIQAALTPDDWNRLYLWFRLAKLDSILQASPSEIDISHLPDASDGHMVPFVEVFPLGLDFHFQMRNEIWAADDQFCVQPRCNCNETVLNFLKLRDESGEKLASLKNLPAIRYNHRSAAAREASSGAAGNPPVKTLLAALKTAHPNFDTKLELRHVMMQSVYLRHYLALTKSKLGSALSAPVAPVVSRKVGRNEPCPCGSGKKYKHCCLGK